ncbi:MAG TPA: hypothetical protein VGH81_08540 [Rudaea sp.]|jgi:hypothetical protein
MLKPRAFDVWIALHTMLLCLVTATCEAAGDEATLSDINYRFGDGFQIPGTGINLGGYATASYENPPDAPQRLAIDNLSLFVWWEGDSRWKFFSELEFENALYSRSSDRTDVRQENGYLSLERLYVDYALTDTTDIRAGKFLTPIGHWNLVHATPLVWTTSRPMVTTLAFPTNMTGVMVTQTLPNIGNGIDYSIYGSGGNDLRPNPDLDTFSSAVGAHVDVPMVSGGQLGFSAADFEQSRTRPERKQLVGVDFEWSHDRYEISAEAVYRFSDQGSSQDEKGAFVQFVAPLSGKLFGVVRYETFRAAAEQGPTQLLLTGLNYRITHGLVLKAEWIGSRNNRIGAPDGLLCSIAILL